MVPDDIRIAQKTVHSEEEQIRFMIDLMNIFFELPDRIDNTEYNLFEAFIWAFREFGTINSASAEEYAKNYIGKAGWSRKQYRDTRTALYKKGWLGKDGEAYFLPPQFEKPKKPLSGSDSFLITVKRNDVDREDS